MRRFVLVVIALTFAVAIFGPILRSPGQPPPRRRRRGRKAISKSSCRRNCNARRSCWRGSRKTIWT